MEPSAPTPAPAVSPQLGELLATLESESGPGFALGLAASILALGAFLVFFPFERELPVAATVIIAVVSLGLAAGAVLLAFRKAPSPLHEHFALHPEDPIRRAVVWATVRRGYRAVHVQFTTAAARALRASCGMADEKRVLALVQALVPEVTFD